MIPLAKPYLDETETKAVTRVLESGWIMQGPAVAGFERRIAEYCGVEQCVAVSSGTAALHICYLTLGIHTGNSLVIPSFAWPSAANLALLMNASPLFVDSLHSDYNLDTDDTRQKIERAITVGRRPAAMVPVHQFGPPCDMDSVLEIAEEHNLPVIEDSACGLGSFIRGQHVGSLGMAGILSFHPRKIITTGEGGAIITDDESFAEKCRAYRNHGDLERAGLNYRMTDIQAAIGLVQMDKLSEIRQKRAKLLESYLSLMEDSHGYSLPDYLSHSARADRESFTLQTLMVLLDKNLNRCRIMQQMAQHGVEAKPGSVSAHLLPSHSNNAGSAGDSCPAATELHERGLALPLHPGMSNDEVSRCVEALTTSIRAEESAEPVRPEDMLRTESHIHAG